MLPPLCLRVRTVLSLVLGLALAASAARADLHDYVGKKDDSFAWKLKANHSVVGGKAYEIEMTSQTWQNIPWRHQVVIYQPDGVKPASTMLLYNTGGSANAANQYLGMQLARLSGAPVAILFGIPNQPLLGNYKEDALIAETFLKYMQTKDESWPLLFPMVKSVIKAMDAIEAFSKQEWPQPVKQFVITGGSKRGWTSWLTGATGDPRVKAIAPMVIDVLNMKAQMDHQKASFGMYSLMIHDYTERKLVPLPNTPEATRLWNIVDPYFYREKLTLPKQLILGNNDPYWTVDALNLYWDGLQGPKWVTYVPNAGHGLTQEDAKGNPDRHRVLGALGAFARHQITDREPPQLTWKHDDVDGKLRLTVEANRTPKAARLWAARALTKDFRNALWEEHPATIDGGKVVGLMDAPKKGCLAFYAELDYEIDGVPYNLSTQLRVAGKPHQQK